MLAGENLKFDNEQTLIHILLLQESDHRIMVKSIDLIQKLIIKDLL